MWLPTLTPPGTSWTHNEDEQRWELRKKIGTNVWIGIIWDNELDDRTYLCPQVALVYATSHAWVDSFVNVTGDDDLDPYFWKIA